MDTYQKTSLYSSCACNLLEKYPIDPINPALLMFNLEENGKGNFNKLKSHLYHKAMLVHVDDEIYLLREDQERLVSVIFPGRKITSVLALEKDFSTDEISYKIENNYYDFTKEDVNKTLECFNRELQKPDVKRKRIDCDGEPVEAGELTHQIEQRASIPCELQKPDVKRKRIYCDGEPVKEEKLTHQIKQRASIPPVPSALESLTDYFTKYINNEDYVTNYINNEENSSPGKSHGI